MNSTPALAPSTNDVLGKLTQFLGPSTEVSYGGSGLKLSYEAKTGAELLPLLAEMGARIEANLALPSCNPGQSEVVIMGEVDDVRFTFRSTALQGGSPRLDVSLFPLPKDSDSRLHRLDSVHCLVESIFASLGDADQSLVGYIAARLHNPVNPEAVARLAAELSSAVANHLTAQVEYSGSHSERMRSAR